MLINSQNGTNGKMDDYNWKRSDSQVFWGEIAPNNHLLQIYENDDVFLNTLESFIENGILEGESVIIIATAQHIEQLDRRMILRGMNTAELIKSNCYIPLDAEDCLAKFMVNDWPDEELFMDMVTALLKRAQTNKRKVRAFGEMVAILWNQGHCGATVRLEYLWNQFCKKQAFCLFCAYPKSGFVQDAGKSITHICEAHTKVISGARMPANQIIYNTNGYV
jgi:hypothetical protein